MEKNIAHSSCAIVAIILARLTALQDDRCATYVTATTACYALGYGILRVLGLPNSSCLNAAEWRSRVLSTVNALILIGGSVLCFLEWPYTPEAEGWVGTDRVWSNPVTFAALFLGFLQWDICWILCHPQYQDTGALVHHSLFIMVTHYVLLHYYFKKPFAWLSFTELSTPFLNARWFLAGRKEGDAYFYASVFFAATFLFTRVLGYTLGLMDMWRSFAVWKTANTGLFLVVLGLHAGHLLNLFWSVKVVAAVKRATKRHAQSHNQ